MKKIPLTRGKFALIDDEDFGIVNQYKWCADKSRNTFYAQTNIPLGKKQKQLKMHRLILNSKKGEFTDHKDMNGLNNQRYNLRKCTQSQNQMNIKPRQNTSSQYKGVFWDKDINKWRGVIKLNKVNIHLGCFTDEATAAKSYDIKAQEFFGEFARLNF